MSRCGQALALLCILFCEKGFADDLSFTSRDFHTSPQTLAICPWDVTCVVSLPSQQAISTGHQDGSIIVWGIGPSQPLRRMTGHEGAVTALDLDEAGRLVSTGEDGTLRIWNAETGECESILHGPADWNTCCTISNDGQWVAAGGYDTLLHVWRREQPNVDPIMLDHEGVCVLSAAFSDDGALLATGDMNGTVRLWVMTDDGPSAMSVLNDASRGAAQALTFLPDASRLVIGYESGIVSVRSIDWSESGPGLGNERALDCSAGVSEVHVLAPGQILATATVGGDICIWSLPDDPEERADRTVLSGHSGIVTGLSLLSRDSGPAFVSVGEDRTIQLWQTKLPATPAVAEIEVPDSRIWALAVSSNSNCFAVGGQKGHLAIRDLESGVLLHKVEGFEESVDSLNFSADGQLLAVSSWKTPIIGIVDVSTGTLKESIEIPDTGRQVVFTHDDQGVFVACGDDRTVHRIDFGGDRLSAAVSELPAYAVDVSPDGNLIAVGSGDWRREVPGTLKVLQSADLSEVATLTGHEHAVRWVSFHPQEPILASSDENGVVLVWDLRTQSILHRLINPDGCKPVRFSPDGNLLAVGLNDGSVQVWDWRKDELVQRMVTDDDVFDLDFSPDGTAIIGVNGERKFFVWPLNGSGENGTAADAGTWTAAAESAE